MSTQPAGFSKGAALDILEEFAGGPLRDEDASLSVGLSIVRAAERDYERISLTFVNLGGTTIFLAPSPVPSSTSGIRLGANGGTISLSISEDGLLPSVEWNAVGDAAGGNLYRLTVRRETRR